MSIFFRHVIVVAVAVCRCRGMDTRSLRAPIAVFVVISLVILWRSAKVGLANGVDSGKLLLGTRSGVPCRPAPRQAWTWFWRPDELVPVLPLDVFTLLMFKPNGSDLMSSRVTLKVFNAAPHLDGALDFSAQSCGTARSCEVVETRDEADVTIEDCAMRHATPRQARVFACRDDYDAEVLASEYCDVYAMTHTSSDIPVSGNTLLRRMRARDTPVSGPVRPRAAPRGRRPHPVADLMELFSRYMSPVEYSLKRMQGAVFYRSFNCVPEHEDLVRDIARHVPVHAYGSCLPELRLKPENGLCKYTVKSHGDSYQGPWGDATFHARCGLNFSWLHHDPGAAGLDPFLQGESDECARTYALGVTGLYGSDDQAYVAGSCTNQRIRVLHATSDTAEAAQHHYKFSIALTSDAVLDALWADTVPIVPTRRRHAPALPSDRAAVFVDDFRDLQRLAAHLRRLDANDAEYRGHFAWKDAGAAPGFVGTLLTGPSFVGCHLCDEMQHALARKRTDPGLRWLPFGGSDDNRSRT